MGVEVFVVVEVLGVVGGVVVGVGGAFLAVCGLVVWSLVVAVATLTGNGDDETDSDDEEEDAEASDKDCESGASDCDDFLSFRWVLWCLCRCFRFSLSLGLLRKLKGSMTAEKAVCDEGTMTLPLFRCFNAIGKSSACLDLWLRERGRET